MRKIVRKWILLLLCVIIPGTVFTESVISDPFDICGIPLEPCVELFTDGLVSFTNVTHHYVELQVQINNPEVNRVSLKVFDPNGKPARFLTRVHVKNDSPSQEQMNFSVRNGRTGLNGTEVFFKSGCRTGIWTIECKAASGNEILDVSRLQIEVREPYSIMPLDLERVRNLVSYPAADGTRSEVRAGSIRFIAQLTEDPLFVDSDWKSEAFDFIRTARNKCTRCAFSMALSWMGIDCTPVRMSEIAGSEFMSPDYDAVSAAIGGLERVDGTLESLWEAYERGEGSPVYIHFVNGNSMHALLLIARDSENPELYYAVNSSEGVNTSKYPGGIWRDHILPIVIEEGRVGKLIQSPLLDRYHKAKIDVIRQWRRTGEKNNAD